MPTPSLSDSENSSPFLESETMIREIIQVVHSSLDINEVFYHLVTCLGQYLQVDRCFISRYEPELHKLSPPTREYRSSPEIESVIEAEPALWVGLESLAHSICKEAIPIDCNEPGQGLSPKMQSILGNIKVQSFLSCAITYQSRCQAILFIHQVSHTRNWTEAEQAVIQSVASQAAVAIHQAEITQSLQNRIHQQKKISQLSQKALSGCSLEELFSDTVQQISQTLNLPYCKIIQKIPEQESLVFRAVTGFNPALVGQRFKPSQEPQAVYTLEALEPVIVEDINQETRFKPSDRHLEYGLISGVSVVIWGPNAPYGVLEVDTEQKRYFLPEDIEYLQSLANLLGIVIERKLVEKAFQKSERRYEVTVQKAGVGIAQVGENGEWLHLNNHFCELLGYSAQELKAMTFQDLTYPEDIQADLALFDQLKRKEIEHYALEKRYIRKEGGLLWVNLTCSMVWDEFGQFEYAVAIVEDISERKDAEQALVESQQKLAASNRNLDQFALMASHDLQAPLRKIRMFFEIIHEEAQQKLSTESLRLINRIDTAIASMQTLISDLLAFSRISQGHEVQEAVDLNRVMQQVLQNLEMQIQEKNAQIKSRVPATVVGDEGLLIQLLQNLVENSLKYQPAGQTPEINIEARYTENHFCQITVNDNGIGFDKGFADQIFQPFKRLHGTTSEYSGSGIGLAICQRIVEGLGGTIEAQSELGKGTLFIIQIPTHADLQEINLESPMLTLNTDQ